MGIWTMLVTARIAYSWSHQIKASRKQNVHPISRLPPNRSSAAHFSNTVSESVRTSSNSHTHARSPGGTRKTLHIYFHYMLAYIILARRGAAHITHSASASAQTQLLCTTGRCRCHLTPPPIGQNTASPPAPALGTTNSRTHTHSQQPRWHGYNYYCRQCARTRVVCADIVQMHASAFRRVHADGGNNTGR